MGDDGLQVVAHGPVDAPTLSAAEESLRSIHAVLRLLADDLGAVAPVRTRVLVAADVGAAIGDVLGAPFDGERLGAIVAGKTMPTTPDGREVQVVLPAEQWDGGHPTPLGLVLTAHELAHTVLGATRGAREPHLAGPAALSAVVNARKTALDATDEWRADMVGDAMLGGMASATDGEGRALRPRLGHLGLRFDTHLSLLLASHVSPGWPDLVDAYRRDWTDVAVLYEELARQAHRALLAVAHADAEARTLGLPSPLRGQADGRVPGAGYLEHAWGPVRALLDDLPFLSSAEALGAEDEAVAVAGETGGLAMFASLGLTFRSVDADDGMYVGVDEPTLL